MRRKPTDFETQTIQRTIDAVEKGFITVEELAVKMQCSYRTIERWVNRTSRPSSFAAIQKLRRHINHFFRTPKRKKERRNAAHR